MISKERIIARLRHGLLKMSMPRLKLIIEMEIEMIERMTDAEFLAYVEKKTNQLNNRNVVTKKV